MNEEKTECDVCDNKATWRIKWYNGGLQVVHYYCDKCRKNFAPPVKQVKKWGGSISKMERSE